MERAFQLQEEKNSNLKHSSNLKSTVSVEKDLSNPLQSAILSMQKTYGNRYIQELVSGERMACPELCGLKGPLTLSPTKPAAQFKPHSCDSCIFHPQKSAKRVAAGAPNPPGGIPLQAKLKIGQPGDKYEQEADRVADMVLQRQCNTPECEEEEKIRPMRISSLQTSPSIQMQEEIEEEGEEKKKEEEEMLQMRQVSGGTERDENVTQQILQQKGSGRPLEPDVREFMASRFEYDFSDVRIHTDSHAVEVSKKLGAEAFTVGRDVYFGTGKYSPASTRGKRLLGHELTHVVQQGGILSYKTGINYKNDSFSKETDKSTMIGINKNIKIKQNLSQLSIQRYGRDIHEDMTRAEALGVGFSTSAAGTIATEDQAVDTGWRHPHRITPRELINLRIRGEDMLHFPSRSVAVGDVTRAIGSCNIRALGAALHRFQDSYSHNFQTWSVPAWRIATSYCLPIAPVPAGIILLRNPAYGRWAVLKHACLLDYPDEHHSEQIARDGRMRRNTRSWLQRFLGRCP